MSPLNIGSSSLSMWVVTLHAEFDNIYLYEPVPMPSITLKHWITSLLSPSAAGNMMAHFIVNTGPGTVSAGPDDINY